jgi:hypothetical protein
MIIIIWYSVNTSAVSSLRSFAHITEDGIPILPVPATFPTTVGELMTMTEQNLAELENYYSLPQLPSTSIPARRERFRNFIGVGMITN